ncbi:MAG: transporter substrate-binding domain-containing protein [Synergistaceae bacterium]|nr:transporter substrate-binding domain-containing protein [Synergistaceae bacterium]
MNSKKFLMLLVTALVLVSSCAAYADGVRLGMLSQAREVLENTGGTEAPRMKTMVSIWNLTRPEHNQGTTLKLYDNFAGMIMALSSGEIDEILTSKPTAEYIISTNPEFEVCCVQRTAGSYLAFGFRKTDGIILQRQFNTALRTMRKDGKLSELAAKYCADPGKDSPEAVKFEEFPGAETVRVAVTGDMPPMDYAAADGTPAGFSTAVLAEIGRRLEINIKTVQADTGARTAALTSGRVDAVFWYQLLNGTDYQPDAPEDVIFSEAYYGWDMFLHIRKK